MEFDPQAPASPESTDSDKEKRAKRKKRARFVAPIPVDAAAEKPADKEVKENQSPKRSILDEALANLAIKKREGEVPPKPEESEKPGPADASEDEPALDEETYEPLLVHELKPTEFSGGEVIIELQGNKPVVERVEPEPSSELPLEPEEAEAPALPVFAAHPEQAEASAEAESGIEAIAAGGGEAPPAEPPENPISSAESPEPPRPVVEVPEVLPPERLNPLERPAVQADMYPYAPASERPATSQDVKEAVYRAEKAGQNRGVLAGAVFFGGLEHLKHRRREKRLEKHLKKQSKQFTQDREDRHFYYGEQAKRQVADERRLQAVEQQLDQAAKPERLPVKAPEQLPATPEQTVVPAGHRLETSAWHSIEIDNKTGKPVETPAFTYGHEYYRERAQEATPAQERNAAAGEVALVAAAMGQDTATSGATPDTSAMPTPTIPSASTQGPPPGSLRAGGRFAKPAAAGSDAGPLWPWLAALAIVVICLIIVLH